MLLLRRKSRISLLIQTAFVVLAYHRDKSAKADHPNRIDDARFLGCIGEEFGPHANGKLQNMDVKKSCSEIMSQLVNEDQRAEDQNCDENSHGKYPFKRGDTLEPF